MIVKGPVPTGEEVLAGVLRGRRDHATDQLEHRVVLGMDLLIVLDQQPHRRDDQEAPEDEYEPAEALEQGNSSEYEHRSEHQRSEDPPEQDPVLVLAGHGEVAEDQSPDEHVVDRQALFDQVPGQVLARRAPSLPGQDHE